MKPSSSLHYCPFLFIFLLYFSTILSYFLCYSSFSFPSSSFLHSPCPIPSSFLLIFLKPSLPTPSSPILPSVLLFPLYILFLLPLLFVLFSSISSSSVSLSHFSLRSPILLFLVFLLLLFLFFLDLLFLCFTFFLIFSFCSSFPPLHSTFSVPPPSPRSIAVPLFLSILLSLCFLLSALTSTRLARTRCEGGHTVKQRDYVTALCHHLRVTKTGTYWVFRKSLLSQREASLPAQRFEAGHDGFLPNPLRCPHPI